MRNSRKTQLLIVAILGIFTFSFLPVVHGDTIFPGFPGYMAKNLGKGYTSMTPNFWYFPYDEYPATISAEQGSYFTAYIGPTEDEIESGLWPANPYKIKLFIDDGVEKREINLIRFHYYNDEEYPLWGFLCAPESHNWFFTQAFDPGYFETGDYEVTVEYWVKKPYAGSDSNEWRPFVDECGEEWIFTYILTVD